MLNQIHLRVLCFGYVLLICSSSVPAQPPGFPDPPPGFPKLPSPDDLADAISQKLQGTDAQERIDGLLAISQDAVTAIDDKAASLMADLKTMVRTGDNPFEQVLAASIILRQSDDNEESRSLIDLLSRQLQSADPALASQAAQGLVGAADNAEPALLAALASSQPGTRALAAEKLGQIKASGARDSLVGLLDDSSPQVRSAAAKALGQLSLSGTAISALMNLLESDSQMGVKANAAASLVIAAGHTESVKEAVIDAINESDDRTSLAIIRGVAHCDASDDTRAGILGSALIDSTAAKSSEIISHLVELGPSGMRQLITGLDSSQARYWCVVALADFSEQAKPASEKLASLLADSDPDVQTEILLTLPQIDASGTHVRDAVVAQMSSTHDGVRYAAALAAARLGLDGRETRQQLEANASDRDPVLALVSAFALAKLHSSEPAYGFRAMKALATAAKSGDERLKPLAIEALRELKDELKPPPLPALPSFP
ncbi:MAG: HEAT repeat domain-containing protein [Planctomycetota bacterium]